MVLTYQLDLCFTSHPDNIFFSVCIPGLSDHDAVLVAFRSQMLFFKQLPKKVYLYNKANWDEIHQNILEISNTYFNMNSRTVEENWSFMHQKFLDLIQKFIPIKTFRTRYHLP